jgi:hypothetical protein
MRTELSSQDPSDLRAAEARILHRELERRLELIDSANDAEFGLFTALDWTIVLLFFFVLPLLIAWWGV